MENKIDLLKDIIANSKKIVFFGGAGVSTESSVPDFRSVDGLYNMKYKYPPEGQEAALETIMTQCEMWSEIEFEEDKF